jgi:hypothetical protein
MSMIWHSADPVTMVPLLSCAGVKAASEAAQIAVNKILEHENCATQFFKFQLGERARTRRREAVRSCACTCACAQLCAREQLLTVPPPTTSALALCRFNFWWIVVPLCVIWACWHRAAAALSK